VRTNFSLGAAQEVGQIVLLEHLNMDIPDQILASIFYCEGLGLTRDPYEKVSTPTMWINNGYQQFHLPMRGSPQTVDGIIGLVFPDLSLTVANLKRVEKKLKDTKFSWKLKSLSSNNKPTTHQEYIEQELIKLYSGREDAQVLEVFCPWGNQFRIHQQPEDKTFEYKLKGSIGLPYIELLCPLGTAREIGQFYQHFFDVPVLEMESNKLPLANGGEKQQSIAVVVGPAQRLIFTESPSAKNPLKQETWHIAIYVNNFMKAFQKFKEEDLIFVDERFADRASTLEAALEARQFR
jgi:hypothetical protein